MRSLYLISLVYLCLCTIFGLTIAQDPDDNGDAGETTDPIEFKSDEAKNGSFSSSGFPQPYPRTKNYTFTFIGKEKFLKLNFTTFNLPANKSNTNKGCSLDKGDRLELIPDGTNDNSNVTKIYCGKQDPFSITLNTSSITVTLVSSWKNFSNSNSETVGFQANYEFTNKTSSGLSNLSSGSSLYLVLTTLCLITSSGLGLRFI